ncbi:terpene synthase family protein [Streptomyces sp. UNOC14_S4]|uniref:terpene synthase family protein n=1 Tax=Streptomyces sp. UNOC14_S4 TaxID=2872340 RepID=UPI001E4A0B0D|nr:terpene synthase family protein [Streptomyces sp. UNOC14_S4]MCC3768468.1 terpene synthase family protein [Streptomyces sp. UNOC14_S4]
MTMTTTGPLTRRPAPGTPYCLPVLDIRLPTLCSPYCAEAEHVTHEEERPLLASYFGGERAALRYQKQRATHWACLCFPRASRERLLDMLPVMHPLALMDDVFSLPAVRGDHERIQRYRELFEAACAGQAVPPGLPEVRLVRDTVPRAVAHMPSGLAARYLAGLRDIVVRTAAQSAGHDTHTLRTLDAYLKVRRVDVFGFWSAHLVEYTAEVDLTEELVRYEDLATAQELAIDSLIWVNDLYSFPKELARGDSLNSVWILMDVQERELQQAVDEVARLVEDTERRFVATCARIGKGPLGGRPDVRRYLTDLGYLMTGNLAFHRMATRYHGDDYAGDGALSGPRTLRPIVSTATIDHTPSDD